MWQKSKCKNGMWLHDWLILRQTPEGLEEYCYRCGMTKLFTHKEDNAHYLSYHLRMMLSPRFNPKEYHVEYEKR